jgi:DNA-binding NarL/FixJ family response regulator
MRVVMRAMTFRLLVAEKDPEFCRTLLEVSRTVVDLLPIDLSVRDARSMAQVRTDVTGWQADAVLLDWNIADHDTPAFIKELQTLSPGLRVLTLLPASVIEYRRTVWEAGACASIPRDRLDPEWLATAVCIMTRAMQREARLKARVRELCPVMAEVLA